MWFNALVELKKRSGKTLKQISEESKVPLGTLNKLFSGQTKDPKLETVQAVVHALGYTLDDLDAGQNTKESPSAAEAAPGEDVSNIFDQLNDTLVSIGLIKDGEDLTAQQAEVLIAICRIINATFQD